MKTRMIISFTLILMSASVSYVNAQCIANAGNDTTVCGYSVNLHGTWSHNAGAELSWTSTLPNVYFSDPASEITSATIPNYIQSSFQVTFIFTETIPPAICVSSDTVVVTFLKPPYAEAGPVQSVCGYTTILTADTLGVGLAAGSWNCIIPSITITPVVPGPIPSTVTVDATAAAGLFLNSMLEAWFYWTADNGICTNTDSVRVSFYEIPDAYAGVDDAICGKTYDLVGQFSLDNPTGSWTILSKPYVTSTASFVPSNQPDGAVTASDYGVYHFVWTERNDGNTLCYDRDTLQIHFLYQPVADAGTDQSVCGKYVMLTANQTPGTVGYWHSVLNGWFDASVWPGDTVFISSTENRPNIVAYYSSENVTVTYYWTEFNGYCFDYDSVNVYFGSYPYPPLNPYSSDTMVCGTTLTTLQIQQPNYGTGYWYDTDPLTQFYPDNSSLYPDSVVIEGNAYGMHSFYYVLENGCIVTSNAVQVWFGGTGVVHGTISGLGGNTDFTAAVYESGSPVVKGSGTPDAAGLYSVAAPAGTYFLKVNIDDPAAHTGMATTYYGNTWKWADALTINVPACDTTTANITMYTFPLATGGVCRAYGTVMYDMGGPVEGANVYLLYKPVNTPAILELTDASGYYSLNNIPNGNYKIQVDIPGLPQVTTHHITVNPNDTAFPNVNFIVDTINISKEYGYGVYADSNFVYGIGEQLSDARPLHVYPVPFSNELFIESFSEANMSIEWYSQKGEMISVSVMNCFKGTNSIVVPDDLSKGIYYLKVTTGNTVYIKKLIKE
jgi:hypothetical protein